MKLLQCWKLINTWNNNDFKVFSTSQFTENLYLMAGCLYFPLENQTTGNLMSKVVVLISLLISEYNSCSNTTTGNTN